MTIADLFVNIGIKGDGSAKRGLTEVRGSLSEVRSAGLAAKASIVGLIYGMQQLMSASAARGTELYQFANATGLSAMKLQQWQHAARQFGLENQEVAGSIQSVQAAMTNMIMGKGAPEGFGIVAQAVGLDPSKVRDTFYVMNKLQEFAKKVPPDVGLQIAKSFGISQNLYGFLRANRTEIDKISPSKLFSEGQIRALARVDAAWKNLFNTFKLIAGGITANFGMKLLGGLSNSIKFMQGLSKDVGELTKRFNGLKEVLLVIGGGIALYFAPITTAIAGLIFLMDQLQKKKEGKSNIFSDFESMMKDSSKSDENSWFNRLYKTIHGEKKLREQLDLRERMKSKVPNPATDIKKGSVLDIGKIEINVQNGDPKTVRTAVMDGIQTAYRQYSSLATVT